jgi:hypothetical protein
MIMSSAIKDVVNISESKGIRSRNSVEIAVI